MYNQRLLEYRFSWFTLLSDLATEIKINRMMFFPLVNGSNLLREKLTLPRDFKGKLNLVFIAFEQWHQMEVDSWMLLARKLEDQFDGLVYYELPTIENRNSFLRMFINEGMRAGIPNPKTRERTITLYLDIKEFRAALDLPDEEHICVLLVDPQGKEYFRARGAYNPDLEAALRQTISQLALKARP